MNRLINIIVLLTLTCANGIAQSFEGKIVYQAEYRNTADKRDTALDKKYGNKEEFYIKNGDYLIKTNGTVLEWKLYKHQTNLIYEKHKNNDTLYTTDASVNNDTIYRTSFYRNLGKSNYLGNIKLNEYVFECKSGVQYFYSNKKYKMDKDLFIKHKYGHLNIFLEKSNSIPIILIFNTSEYNCYKETYSFEPLTLENNLFDIPKGLKIKPN